MMEKAALFATVVAALAFCAVNGSPVDRFARLEANDPERCCLPRQYSTNMTDLGTINNAEFTVFALQTDYDKQQQVLLNYTGSFKTPQSKILIDFRNDMMYIVLTKDPEKCYKFRIKLPSIRCIPDDAEYLARSYLGSLAGGMLPFDAWKMTFTTRNITTISTLAVTRKGCVPLVEVVSYPQNPNPKQFYMFSGFHPFLTDPSAFNLPESCNRGVSTPAVKTRQYPDHLATDDLNAGHNSL